MLIGELSKKTGLSRDTIRFYEKESLIAPDKPVGKGVFSNNYKDYPESVVSILLFIQGTKALGFTLSEIREMLELRSRQQMGTGTKSWATKAEVKLGEIDRKIADLKSLKVLLAEALARCSDLCLDRGCEVLDEAVANKSKTGPRPIHELRIPNKGNCCSG